MRTCSLYRTFFSILGGFIRIQKQPSIEELPDANTSNNVTVTRYIFKKEDKPEVTLLKVKGGQNAFPKDLDIFLESWAFFNVK